MQREYLIDESIFVYLNRQDYKYHSQLVAFLEDGSLNHLPDKRKHRLYMPYSAKLRIGALRLFGALTFMKKWFKYKRITLAPLEKSEIRAQIAKTYVSGCLKLPFLKRVSKWLFPKTLINLFIYANENKSKHLQRKEKRKILPNEVIPLETCEVAMIAKRYGLDILSFNSDFGFLTMLPGKSESYITYIHPNDLLKEYIGDRSK